MTKKPKIWLTMSISILLIPEILWSTLGNFYFELTQTSKNGGTLPFRDNFLQNPDNFTYLKTILFVQFIGALITLCLLWVNRKNIANSLIKWLMILAGLIILILTAFAAYFVFTFKLEIF